MKTYTIPRSIYDSAAIQSGITTALIGLSVLLPFVLHAILPAGGTKTGAMLLPMFYAPVLGVFLLKKKYVFLIGLAAPLLNFLLTGAPVAGMLILLTGELLLFTLFLLTVKNNKILVWVGAPLALLAAKGILALLMVAGVSLYPSGSAGIYLSHTITAAVPGLVILLALSIISGFAEKSKE